MKLSVITISFNAETCIENTIQSVLNQTNPIYEYIFIDGGSIDKTNSIIESYRQKFENRGIRFIHISEPDEGISDAFNKGIYLATGDLIGIINADDELLPDANEILLAEYKKEKADIYYGNCIWVDTINNFEYISKAGQQLDMLLYYMILKHPSTFVAKKAYDNIGVFDITYMYCMDKELLYRMYLSGAKFQYINKELTRFKAGGVSDRRTRDVLKEDSRMALSYNEPIIKVKCIEVKKLLKHKLSIFAKKFTVYRKYKMRNTSVYGG